MPTPEETHAIVQAAEMYYNQRLNQQEIARLLGVTRQTVSRLLRDAIEYNIVEFRIHVPYAPVEDLSERLARRFGLAAAVVVPSKVDDSSLIPSVLSQYAARHVYTLVEQGAERIGLCWGRTMYRMIHEFPESHFGHAAVFPLIGASSRTAPYFMLNDMVRCLADRMNAAPVYAYIPADPESEEDEALFRRTSTYATIAGYWQGMDLAIFGIGVHPGHERYTRTEFPGERTAHPTEQVVGDIVTHYFDAEGNFLDSGAKILCADLGDLRRAKRRMAVSGGSEKTEAILGALKTGMLTDIVIDERTCNRILRMIKA